MGCVGPRLGTPPSESDSRPADVLVPGIFDFTPGAAPKRRVNRRRTAGPRKVHHSPAQTMTGVRVPETVSPHAPWAYSWIRPPRWSWRRMRILLVSVDGCD